MGKQLVNFHLYKNKSKQVLVEKKLVSDNLGPGSHSLDTKTHLGILKNKSRIANKR